MHCQVAHCILDCAKQIRSLKVTVTSDSAHSLGFIQEEYFENLGLFPSSAIRIPFQLRFLKKKKKKKKNQKNNKQKKKKTKKTKKKNNYIF